MCASSRTRCSTGSSSGRASQPSSRRRSSRLGSQLQGFQLALEYISDYVKICGLKLWQEELAGVLNFYVEQERNAFLRRRVHAWQSTFVRAAEAAAKLGPPPPSSGAGGSAEHSFFGKLVREMVSLTSPRRSVYSEAVGGWVDVSGREVVGGRLMHLLQTSIGRCGLRGIGSTLGFMVTAQLHRFVRVYSGLVSGDLLAGLDVLSRALHPTTTLPDKPQKQYQAIATLGSRLMAEIHETVWRCGAAQLLRAHLASALGGSTRIDCSLLATILATADAALLAEVKADDMRRARGRARRCGAGDPTATIDGADPPSTPTPSLAAADGAAGGGGRYAHDRRRRRRGGGCGGARPLRALAADGSRRGDLGHHALPGCLGAGSAQGGRLVVAPVLPRLALALAVFTYTQLSKMQWSSTLAALTEAKGKLTDESIDGVPLVSGIICILRQFNAEATTLYTEHLMQLLRAMLHSGLLGDRQAGRPAAGGDHAAALH